MKQPHIDVSISLFLHPFPPPKKRKKKKEKKKLVTRGLPYGRGRGRMGEEVRGLRSTNRWLQNRNGDVKHSIGNGVAK